MKSLTSVREAVILGGGAVVLAVVTIAGYEVGQRAGAPDPVEVPVIESVSPRIPPMSDGFFGYEGINDRLQLGFWGTVANVETVPVENEVTNEDGTVTTVESEVLQVTIASGDGAETVLTMSDESFVRILSEGDIATGDRITIRRDPDGSSVLITRLAESSAQ